MERAIGRAVYEHGGGVAPCHRILRRGAGQPRVPRRRVQLIAAGTDEIMNEVIAKRLAITSGAD
jgi:alkylation response protein AidB-like acyl-CoA dehydrogenase